MTARTNGEVPPAASASACAPVAHTGIAEPILHEVAQALSRLVASGQTAAVDLTSLPMTAADRAELENRLGQGEVSAIITAAGESHVWETGFAGVWWVRHHAAGGRIACEEILVSRCPEILKTHPDDARDGLARLTAMLAEAAATASEPDANSAEPEDRP